MKPGALVTVIEERAWLWSVDPLDTGIMTLAAHGRGEVPAGAVGLLITRGKLHALDTGKIPFVCVLFCSGRHGWLRQSSLSEVSQ